MSQTNIKLKTYSCPVCAYRQDFDPGDATLQAKNHPGVPVGKCPACYAGANPTRTKQLSTMALETNLNNLMQATIKGLEDVIATQLDTGSKDAQGKPIYRAPTQADIDAEMVKVSAAITNLIARKHPGT